jgi:predicted transcriptional regulator
MVDRCAIWRILKLSPRIDRYGTIDIQYGEKQIPDEPATVQNTQGLTAELVSSYVRRNHLGVDQLASLISTVHQTLANLGKPAEAPDERAPAVSARQSVHRDYVICMDCGWKGSVLKRHLTPAHGLSVDQYRARWNLKSDHPITAPAYSERRSTMAKQIGLGRIRGTSAEITAVPETKKATQQSPKGRRRPKSAATPTY